MNLFVGGAASLIASTKTVPAQSEPSDLGHLIRKYYESYRSLSDALLAADKVGSPARRIKVLGGRTTSSTITCDGKTTLVPARDWYFHSTEDIQKEYLRELCNAPDSDSETVAAIENKFAGFRREAAEQLRDNKKASSEQRKAEAKLRRAHRDESRALQGIVDHEPKNRVPSGSKYDVPAAAAGAPGKTTR